MIPFDLAKKTLTTWEGEIRYLYLDVKGFVTIGIGCRASLEQAEEMQFVYREDDVTKAGTAQTVVARKGDVASKAAIAEDYNVVEQHQELRKNPYKTFTKLDLTRDALDTLLGQRIATFEAALRKRFSDFDSFPVPAQLALLDLSFNVGRLGGFPSLVKAAKQHDWLTASKQCLRKPPISEARNQWTVDQFTAAAELDKTVVTSPDQPTEKVLPRTVKTMKTSAKDLQLQPDSALVAPRAQGRR
jgi:hypothetical protein